MALEITLNSNMRLYNFRARFAWAIYREVSVRPSPLETELLLEHEMKRVKKEFVLESIKEEEGVAVSRHAFRAIGCDPARYRPSQEALMRRILKGQSINLVNSGVDINNILSLMFRVPMGIYNLAAIKGNLQIKVGEPEEFYVAINGRQVDGYQKFLLCDSRGPVGSPYVDSIRTSLVPGIYNVLHVVYFLPPRMSDGDLQRMGDTIVTHMHGGKELYHIIKTD